ncbi:Transcription initiation factor TFIID subunit 9 [Dictyocoela muelleri]|nr:Transcription initiation factor TFIID subunit 9 [Dictyocoela muelleri]
MNEPAAPRDPKVISLILRSLGIEECEAKVIIQILEFVYKYSIDIMEDAAIYANMCNRRISANDIKLAIKIKIGKYFVPPPPRHYMMEIASQINSKPLVVNEGDNYLKLPNKLAFLTSEQWLKKNDRNEYFLSKTCFISDYYFVYQLLFLYMAFMVLRF